MLGLVKDIVKYFKHNVQASDQLRKVQGDMQTPLKLIQSVCTRWNSTYYQLKKFVILADKTAPILLSNSKAPLMLTAAQLDSVKDIIQIYEPLEKLTKEVSSENYITSSKIIPMIYCLNKSLQDIHPNTELGNNTKAIIINKVYKRFGAIQQVNPIAISTLLDPRFKDVIFTDKVACSQTIDIITSMLSDIEIEAEELPLNGSGSSVDVEDPESSNIWRFHTKLVKETYPGQGTNRNISGINLENYLIQPPEHRENCDPIKYWYSHKDTVYNKLSKIALNYLCIVATSVPSERLFSIAGNILTLSRNRLAGERLHKLIFLKSLKRQHWHVD